MTAGVRAPKEFWLGVLYALTGAVGYIISREYPFGSGARMGPGYFPTIICILLFLFGIGAIARAFRMSGEPVHQTNLKTIALIIGSLVLFGLLLEPAGFVIAGLTLLIVSALASAHFRVEWKAVLGAVALILICALVFIKALGVPMPWLGPWLTPLLPAAFAG